MGDNADNLVTGEAPEYTVDPTAGAFDLDKGDAAAGQPTGEPGEPAAPGEPGAPMDAAGQPGEGEGAGAGEPAEEYIERFPRRRLAEITGKANEAIAAARVYKTLLDQIMTRFGEPKPPAQPAAPPAPEDPKAKAIRDRLYEVIPGLKLLDKLGANFDRILEAAEMVPESRTQNERYWDAVALHTTNQLFDGYATMTLGKEKTATDLSDAQRLQLHEDFATWVMRDQSGRRRQRYEALDGKLVGEFLTGVRTTYIDPLRRTAAAPVARRIAAARTLPRGGGATPVATAPPKPKPQDEEAVHSAGWKALQDGIAAVSAK
jgi:hypothetical protein